MPHGELTNAFSQYLKYAHGIFNGFVILFFIYQGWLGLKIRRNREAGILTGPEFVKMHRKFGPVLAAAGILGFLGGVTVVYLSDGEIFEHPIHFLAGLTISVLIVVIFGVSRKIRASESGWRTIHYRIGLTIVSLYILQAYLGISMLF